MNEEAAKRAKTLSHRHKYRIESAQDAFGVPASTLYQWRATLKKHRGHLKALNNKSRAPKRTRMRSVPAGLKEEFIMRRKHLMADRGNFGKLNEKLQEYVRYCNTVRPHTSLGFLSPEAYYVRNRENSHM